jgi:hypothetical protein
MISDIFLKVKCLEAVYLHEVGRESAVVNDVSHGKFMNMYTVRTSQRYLNAGINHKYITKALFLSLRRYR